MIANIVISKRYIHIRDYDWVMTLFVPQNRYVILAEDKQLNSKRTARLTCNNKIIISKYSQVKKNNVSSVLYAPVQFVVLC